MAGNESKDQEVFNLDRIKNLVQLMEEHGLSEIDLRQEEQRIKLRRGPEISAMPPMTMTPASPPMVTPPSEPAPIVQAGSRADDDENTVLIKSPMVGTFYTRANPESPAFVKVGDHVSADQTVCIIEAMKVFNEIPAEITGTIVAILVEDEEAVDFGKPLFKVDTSK